MNPDDDPLAQLMALKAKQSDPLDELMKTKAPKPKIGQMGHAITTDESAPDPSYAQQALGGIAALNHAIPGAEATQAGVRSLIRRQPYSEALSDIKGAENSANKWVRRYNNLAGGAIAAAAAPKGGFMNPLGKGGSIAMQGARFGAAEGLLSAEPQSGQDRVLGAGKNAAITSIAGKVLGEFIPNSIRTTAAKSLGEKSLQKAAQMEANDATAYGKAATEGVGATDPAVTAALNHQTVKPYAAEIRNSPLFKGADDATVLREAYKLMTEKQQTLAQRVINSSDYKAGSQLEKAEIAQGKRQLLAGADKIMPSFRPAVYQHATAKGEINAFRSAADATGRIVRKASVAGRKLDQNSPEAFKKSIHLMSEQEAKSALEGVLGKLKTVTGVTTANPLKGFGIPKSISSINGMAPFLEALDSQAGNTGGILRRALGISAGADIAQ